MLADLRRAWALLVQGRSGKAVALEFAGIAFATAVLWAAACVFVLLEPLP